MIIITRSGAQKNKSRVDKLMPPNTNRGSVGAVRHRTEAMLGSVHALQKFCVLAIAPTIVLGMGCCPAAVPCTNTAPQPSGGANVEEVQTLLGATGAASHCCPCAM